MAASSNLGMTCAQRCLLGICRRKPLLDQTLLRRCLQAVLTSNISSTIPCAKNNYNLERYQENVYHIPKTAEVLRKGIGLSAGEQTWKTICTPDQPENAKLLCLSIIGQPNCGKSTLTNQLMGLRVSSVSKKVHTTRKKTTGVWTHNETQIVFLDTPGMIIPRKRHKHHLEKSLLTDPLESLETADLVAVVVDVSEQWNRTELDKEVLKALYLNPTIPSILILNKVDALKNKQVLLSTVRQLTEGIVGGKQVSSPKQQKKKLKLAEFVPNSNDLNDTKMSISKNDFSNLNSVEFNAAKNSTDISSEQLVNSDSIDQSKDNLTAYEYSEHYHSQSETDSSPAVEPNKNWMDLHEKLKEVRRIIRNKAGWSNFDKVFMVSAKTGDGVQELKEYLLGCAKPADWLYHSSLVTDQDPMEIAKTCVWEKLLDNLRDEIPYNLQLDVSYWDVDTTGGLKLAVDVICSSQRYMMAALGRGGETIKKVSTHAEEELSKTFQRDVYLKVMVKLRK